MTKDEAWKIGVVGLPEDIRKRVMTLYKVEGGTMANINVAALRRAMKMVRRQEENRGKVTHFDITRREDILEMGVLR